MISIMHLFSLLVSLLATRTFVSPIPCPTCDAANGVESNFSSNSESSSMSHSHSSGSSSSSIHGSAEVCVNGKCKELYSPGAISVTLDNGQASSSSGSWVNASSGSNPAGNMDNSINITTTGGSGNNMAEVCVDGHCKEESGLGFTGADIADSNSTQLPQDQSGTAGTTTGMRAQAQGGPSSTAGNTVIAGSGGRRQASTGSRQTSTGNGQVRAGSRGGASAQTGGGASAHTGGGATAQIGGDATAEAGGLSANAGGTGVSTGGVGMGGISTGSGGGGAIAQANAGGSANGMASCSSGGVIRSDSGSNAMVSC